MSDSTRRVFLGMAGAGAAAVGAATVTPAVFASTSGGAETAPAAASDQSEGPVVAYVGDERTGEISLMVGEREVVVHDRALARRLRDAAGR